MKQYTMPDSIYDAAREWESFKFPVEISNLRFEKNHHALAAACSIAIWRDENFKLQAKLKGYTLYPNKLRNIPREDGPGNFAAQDVITGADTFSNLTFVLDGCLIVNFSIEGIEYPGLGLPFTAKILFDSIKSEGTSVIDQNHLVQYDWFISGRLNLLFPESTARFYQEGVQRMRQEALQLQTLRYFMVVL